MLDAFTKMLRYSMRDMENIVPLEKELDYVEKYLFLQNLRFGNRVKYKIQVHQELLNLQLPFFTLQPLVENAIIHGLEPKESGGSIQITTEVVANKIAIMIQDNGLGISPEKLKLLQNMDIGAANISSSGIGISNVHSRLKLFFGDNYGFDIKSKLYEGTTVILTFWGQA